MAEEAQEMSREDRFFGVKHTVGDDDEQEQLELEAEEVSEEEPEESEEPGEPSLEEQIEQYLSEKDNFEKFMTPKVQKRIDTLTYKWREEERQKQELEKLRDEAIRYAQNMQQQNQQYQRVITEGEGLLLKQIRDQAAAQLETAKGKYRKAYEEGDTDAVIAAQDEMLKAHHKYAVADERLPRQQQQPQEQFHPQFQQQFQQPQQMPPQQPQVPKPSERSMEWAEKNPWFGKQGHEDLTAAAYGIHEKLIRHEGYEPDSEEYFEEIDTRMRRQFPDYFEKEPPSRKPSTPVAPAARSSGKKSKQVKLDAHQHKLIKKLGITPEQYIKSMQRGTP